MTLIDAARSVLVLVDYQQRLMPAILDGPQVLAHAQRLARAAGLLGVPVVGTEQNPRGLGPNEASIRALCSQTLPKMHFDACAQGLLGWLDGAAVAHRTQVVIAGCEAHVCLMQTALGLLHAGRPVWVVAQASGSRSATDHRLAMERLRQAGATIVGVEMVLFEWLRTCEHEQFKPILASLKSRTP